jgi:SPP1 family phage portal protein
MPNDLVKMIKEDMKKKQGKYEARKYFHYKPEKKQMSEIDVVDADGNVKTIKLGSSAFLYTNYFKMLVNQKINYLLAKEPTVKETEVMSITVITDLLEDLLLNAALDTAAWVHFYVNEENRLDWILIHDSEIIPLYDKYNKNIIGIIRYYKINEEEFKIEEWNLKGVTITTVRKDKIVDSIHESHFVVETVFNGELENMEAKNLPFIPFLPLYNNKSKVSDMDGIHELLDMYNQINSGFVDNINRFQEAIMKLKGFSGDKDTLKETMDNLKTYKMAGMPEDGDMEYMAVEIPVEARKVILDILKENIFKIGQGLDPDTLGDGNITNVVIKNRYSGLDMKANGTEKQIKLFYEKFARCLTLYYMTKYDDKITCNRSMLINEKELIESCVMSMGLISMETIIEHHPWPTDVQKEMEKLKAEKKEAMDEFNKNNPENNHRSNKNGINQDENDKKIAS